MHSYCTTFALDIPTSPDPAVSRQLLFHSRPTRNGTCSCFWRLLWRIWDLYILEFILGDGSDRECVWNPNISPANYFSQLYLLTNTNTKSKYPNAC